MTKKLLVSLFVLASLLVAVLFARNQHPTPVVNAAAPVATFVSVPSIVNGDGPAPIAKSSHFNNRMPGCMGNAHVSAVALANHSVETNNMTGGSFGHPACVPVSQPSIVAIATRIVHDVVATFTAPTTVVPTTTATLIPAPTFVAPSATPSPEITATQAPTNTPDAPTATQAPTQAPTEESCTNAQPGNLKCVGKASEDPNGRGTMPLDNTGGGGNGQHGNQGTNPHAPTSTPEAPLTQGGIGLVLFAVWAYQQVAKGHYTRVHLFDIEWISDIDLERTLKLYGVAHDGVTLKK